MKTIWKFELEATRLQNIIMPKGAKILCVQMQGETACLWALVNPDEKETEARNIETFGTGHTISEDEGTSREYIGTYQLLGGSLVFHVFEYTGI